jgi:hypothetical protein
VTHSKRKSSPGKGSHKNSERKSTFDERDWVRSIHDSWQADRRKIELGKTAFSNLNHHPPIVREWTPPDEIVFAQLVGLTRIPGKDVEKFQQGVIFAIDREWIHHKLWRPIKPHEGKIALKLLKKLKRSSEKYCPSSEILRQEAS